MPNFDESHALVVGIAGYQNIRPLPKVEDVQGIAEALCDPTLCGYPKDNVHSLLEDKATGNAIRTGLADIARVAGPKSSVFIYFLSFVFSLLRFK